MSNLITPPWLGSGGRAHVWKGAGGFTRRHTVGSGFALGLDLNVFPVTFPESGHGAGGSEELGHRGGVEPGVAVAVLKHPQNPTRLPTATDTRCLQRGIDGDARGHRRPSTADAPPRFVQKERRESEFLPDGESSMNHGGTQ
ncbi:hypothetical protein GN956_G18612 [Arapaima gigas]